MSGTSTFDCVGTVVVHYRTPDLLRQTVDSFRAFYPAAELLIVDNGSPESEREMVRNLAAGNPENTKTVFLERNIFHGPAMHLAMSVLEQEFVFFLDSDTMTRRGGFLEAMSGILSDGSEVYGVGRVGTVNKRGFHSVHGTEILFSPYMMVRRAMYVELPPFEHHGAPTMKNFSAAAKRGWRLAAFPVEESIEHLGRGTSGVFGYGLGLRGIWEHLLNKAGI